MTVTEPGQIALLKESQQFLEEMRETVFVEDNASQQEAKPQCVHLEVTEKIKEDLNSTLTAKQNLEKEIRSLQERLVVSQRAWEALQEELSYLKRCSSKQEEILKSCIEEARAGKNLHDAFKEKIITLLQSKCNTVSPSDEVIVETIREMCQAEESNKTVCEHLLLSIISIQHG
ncbi:UNVERIFIED_CONTAM: hypothetical protein K2H54_062595 [Gekko kuhli]